jgi:beta-N-acetylhexosaminidase
MTATLGALLLAVCALLAADAILDNANEPAPVETPARAQLRKMVGQMLIIGFPGTSMAEEWPSRVARMIGDGEIGGVLLLSENIRSPAQLKSLTAAFAEAGGPLQPFIAVDQEGGAVQRLTQSKGFSGLPSAGVVALSDPGAALALYSRQAEELAQSGITVNFGPVVDLNVNPYNPIIARLDRSYGDRADFIAPFARAFVKAHENHGIMTAAKHFPGHGSSMTDSHQALADISESWTQEELLPFKQLAGDRQPVPMIMVGHLVLNGYSDGDAPTSLSHRTVTEILRKELSYDGLIITDDLDMGAVRGRYSVEEAFVKAAAAGNDLIMAANIRAPDPHLVTKVTAAIMDAVDRGEIPRSQIAQSYKRILAAKSRMFETRRIPNSRRGLSGLKHTCESGATRRYSLGKISC